jgi:hypothetical protein
VQVMVVCDVGELGWRKTEFLFACSALYEVHLARTYKCKYRFYAGPRRRTSDMPIQRGVRQALSTSAVVLPASAESFFVVKLCCTWQNTKHPRNAIIHDPSRAEQRHEVALGRYEKVAPPPYLVCQDQKQAYSELGLKCG